MPAHKVQQFFSFNIKSLNFWCFIFQSLLSLSLSYFSLLLQQPQVVAIDSAISHHFPVVCRQSRLQSPLSHLFQQRIERKSIKLTISDASQGKTFRFMTRIRPIDTRRRSFNSTNLHHCQRGRRPLLQRQLGYEKPQLLLFKKKLSFFPKLF